MAIPIMGLADFPVHGVVGFRVAAQEPADEGRVKQVFSAIFVCLPSGLAIQCDFRLTHPLAM